MTLIEGKGNMALEGRGGENPMEQHRKDILIPQKDSKGFDVFFSSITI